MATISAHIDKDLKDKLTSKAHKEGKSVSDLVREALNGIDFGKEEFNEVDDEPINEKLRSEIREAIPPLKRRLGKVEDRISTLEEIDVDFYDIAKSLSKIASHYKRKRSKTINKLIDGVSRNVLKTDELNANIRKNKENIESIRRELDVSPDSVNA